MAQSPYNNDLAFFGALPAVLPGIGTSIPLSDALSWLAFDKPSNDIQLYENDQGEVRLSDSKGNVITNAACEPMTAWREASRRLHEALRDGSLPAYIMPDNSSVLCVSHFYWNSVNPDSLDLVYRGMSQYKNGAGCVILLLRLEFDNWRASIAAETQREMPSGQSTVKAIVECSGWLTKAFADDPEKKRNKNSFQNEALEKFRGRLSRRGFLQVWSELAPASGRSTPGRKKS